MLLSIAVVVGCGVRTAPRPPEDTAPKPPAELDARLDETGVRLRWERPSQAVDGDRLYDLAGFVVERRSEGAEFIVFDRIQVDDNDRIRPQQSFTIEDPSPPTGLVLYRVRSVAADGQHGHACPPVHVRVESPD